MSGATANAGMRPDTLHHDPLLDCLLELTRIHGRPTTAAALVAGLPLEKGILTPSLFARAASRAGLAAKVVRRSLDKIDTALLPVVLLTEGDEACVLLGWDDAAGGSADADAQARLLFPDTGQGTVLMSREDLLARYTGIAIFARPHFRFDKRTPTVGEVKLRHWFWGALADQWLVYRDVLLAAVMINLIALVMPLFSMNVYDRVIPNHAFETLWVLALGVVLMMAVDFVLRQLRGYFIDLASARIDLQLSGRIMERVLGVRMEARPAAVGAFASNLRSFETVRDFITSATVTALIDLPFALLFVVVVGLINWVLVLPVLFAIVAVVLYAYVIQYKMHELSETTYRAGAMRNANLVESLVGLETVKALGAEGVMQRKWEQSATFLARTSTQLRLLAATTMNGAMGVSQLVYLSVIVIGVYRIGAAELSMGGLIACSMLASRAMAPFGQVAGLLTQYHNASTALKSLDGIMANEVERPADANFVSRSHFEGAIEFNDVSFAYPNEERDALRHVSFSIKPGEHVALIGRVGSGKTTLQKLILGLYRPTSGSVRIDGVDIRQLDPAELRRNAGYVPQDASLFYGSLRDNIVLASPEVDDTALLAAADVGGLTDLVNSHPRGFDMVVGERGESLSGGQRQGVAIARAVISAPPILLLDEPTGAMDFSSEDEIKRKLRDYCAGKTMVVVTHRTSLLDLVDRIIVIDHGRVVADGPKASVIEALKHGRIERAK